MASAGVSRAVLRVFVVLVHSAQAPVWTSYLAAKIEYMDRPLASAEFLVIEFDHHRGTLKVVDDYTYSASEESQSEARRRAKEAAREAAAAGRDCTVTVVRIATEAVYSA